MANEDLQREIALLREQLDEIKNEREARSSITEIETDEQAVDGLEVDISTNETATASETVKAEDLLVQFKEMLDSIDKDIKDTKPSTLLIVFTLGVLVGRL